MNPSRILLASHGTPGARAAEVAALALARQAGAALHQLVVVPDLWKGMLGDDWLNNAVTHIRFGGYVESQLGREIAQHIRDFEAQVIAEGLAYDHEIRQGKPVECLLATLKESGAFDLVVIGSPRPLGVPGLRSRLDLETLARRLTVRLLIVPYPES